jgi:EAL domain-containing protein (putative c-di-GMP-specific phosphodiesterase class I)
LQPDFVKIDRLFIEGIHLNAVKRELVGAILKMAEAPRANVIANGIELPDELSMLMDMGVGWVIFRFMNVYSGC